MNKRAVELISPWNIRPRRIVQVAAGIYQDVATIVESAIVLLVQDLDLPLPRIIVPSGTLHWV
jgi:hypothetical protein